MSATFAVGKNNDFVGGLIQQIKHTHQTISFLGSTQINGSILLFPCLCFNRKFSKPSTDNVNAVLRYSGYVLSRIWQSQVQSTRLFLQNAQNRQGMEWSRERYYYTKRHTCMLWRKNLMIAIQAIRKTVLIRKSNHKAPYHQRQIPFVSNSGLCRCGGTRASRRL